jgi:hypothetical protein
MHLPKDTSSKSILDPQGHFWAGALLKNSSPNASQTITDQITDQYAPYCSELRYAVSNDYRVLTDCWWMR